MTRNEAAERLHGLLDKWTAGAVTASLQAALDAALAEERSHVIEQIRDKVGPLPIVSFHTMKYAEVLEALTRFMAALDAVDADDRR